MSRTIYVILILIFGFFNSNVASAGTEELCNQTRGLLYYIDCGIHVCGTAAKAAKCAEDNGKVLETIKNFVLKGYMSTMQLKDDYQGIIKREKKQFGQAVIVLFDQYYGQMQEAIKDKKIEIANMILEKTKNELKQLGVKLPQTTSEDSFNMTSTNSAKNGCEAGITPYSIFVGVQ